MVVVEGRGKALRPVREQVCQYESHPLVKDRDGRAKRTGSSVVVPVSNLFSCLPPLLCQVQGWEGWVSVRAHYIALTEYWRSDLSTHLRRLTTSCNFSSRARCPLLASPGKALMRSHPHIHN